MAKFVEFKRVSSGANFQVAINVDQIAFIQMVVDDGGDEETRVYFTTHTTVGAQINYITLDEKYTDVLTAIRSEE